MQYIALIGPGQDLCEENTYNFCYNLGFALGKHAVTLVSGGLGGVMEAAFKGIKDAQGKDALTVGILPSVNKDDANAYCDIVIPSGIGLARNSLVVSSADKIISVAGGAGTLSEIAFAWQLKKSIFAVSTFGGWSAKLANEQVDARMQKAISFGTEVSDVMRWLGLHEA